MPVRTFRYIGKQKAMRFMGHLLVRGKDFSTEDPILAGKLKDRLDMLVMEVDVKAPEAPKVPDEPEKPRSRRKNADDS